MTDPAEASRVAGAILSALQGGDRAGAARSARKAVKRHGRSPEVLFAAGVAEAADGNRRRGIQHLRRAAELAPDALAIRVNLGTLLLEAGKAEEALSHLLQAERLKPGDPGTGLQLGRALLATGDFASARTVLATVTSAVPNAAEAWLARADADEALGDRVAAQATLSAAIAAIPAHAELQFRLGRVCSMLAAYADAEQAYRQAVRIDPGHIAAWRHLGNMLNKIGRFAEAIPVLELAHGFVPDDPGVIYDLGQALASGGDPQRALNLLDTAPDKVLDTPDFRELAAYAAFRARDVEGVLRRCDAILQRFPARTSALAYRGMALNELGRRDEAAALFAIDRLVAPSMIEVPEGFASIEAFNSAFMADLRNHPSMVYSPLNRTLHQGRSTDELFENPAGTIAVFKRIVENAVRTYRETHPVDPGHPFLAQRPDRYWIGCWANIMDRGGFQDVHFHPPGWLSGVYYPYMPEGLGDGENSFAGWIEFGRAYYMLESDDEPPVTRVRPRPGMIVLFPSYLGHRTIPVPDEDGRTSVAFDVMPIQTS